MITSVVMKFRSQKVGFHVRSILGPLSPVFEVHGVFSYRDLPSTSGDGQSWAVPKAYNILGVSWISLNDNSKEASHDWSWGLCNMACGS